jgi:hypothetical protein
MGSGNLRELRQSSTPGSPLTVAATLPFVAGGSLFALPSTYSSAI